MAFNEGLANDVRARLSSQAGVTEQRMFGGIAFMINGNMAVGVSDDELMVRVGKEAHDQAEARRGARTFDMGARPMRGWISVSKAGYETDKDFNSWVDQGAAFATSLPPKQRQ